MKSGLGWVAGWRLARKTHFQEGFLLSWTDVLVPCLAGCYHEGMKDKVAKTNAMRILDRNGVKYDVVTYAVDEEHLDAVHIANAAGLNLEQVFKTIVMVNQANELFVFCLPAQLDISLKKARELTGSKSIDLLKLDLLQKYTGYIRGGCSPLGMIHSYPTFIEELATIEDSIYVSGGLRGVQLHLSPDDLRRCCNATFASFT